MKVEKKKQDDIQFSEKDMYTNLNTHNINIYCYDFDVFVIVIKFPSRSVFILFLQHLIASDYVYCSFYSTINTLLL